ncbi:putative Alpha/beta-Hydrolases superfamily protein [Hibiscus syriacus]|uniref:Alpha/beta-Hydrolases superfamily protein n=1 Tax=Hibiscus syriacus TaxID=106335 RepID=A0A6A3AKH0_HIBSY|nr:putative Alpha/beta-Hydrolases superfamily protein [Hibiscus syriacus]
MFQVYKDGRVKRLRKTETVPPCDDPQLVVRSKDTPVSTLTSARIFLPQTADPIAKIPQSNAVSVEYRKAPEYKLPIAYDDVWTAIKWVALHAKRDGPEPWLNERADFDRVFLARDSARANIAHNMIMKASGASLDDLIRVRFVGLLLLNPYFMNHGHDELVEFGHVCLPKP